MQHEGLLIGIAEISIALTGFAGVVVVLGRRASGPWPRADQFYLRSLIENGLLAVLASLLPFAVSQHTDEPGLIWGFSSGIFGAVGAVHAFVVQGRRQFRLRRDLQDESTRLYRIAWIAVVAPLSAAVHGALLLNAAGVFFSGTFGPYLYGLLWYLLVGSLFFLRLIRFS